MEKIPTSDFNKVIAILRNLNVNIQNPKKEENFQTRLIIQKLVFLSKIIGINLRRYKFTSRYPLHHDTAIYDKLHSCIFY